MKQKLFLASILTSALTFAQVSIPTLKTGEKYTLLTVLPDRNEMTKDQNIFLSQLEASGKNILTAFTQDMATALISSDKSDLQKLFSITGQNMKAVLLPEINKNKKILPEENLFISVYAIPWHDLKTVKIPAGFQGLSVKNALSGTRAADLGDFNLPLIGDIQVVTKDLSISGSKTSADFYASINSKIRDLALGSNDQFQLQAIALQIRVSKNTSAVRIQLLGQLKSTFSKNAKGVIVSQPMPFIKVNDQVELKEIQIAGNAKNKAMMLTNIEQDLSGLVAENESTKVNIQLGEFGGISGNIFGWDKSLQILTNPWEKEDCKSKLNSVPAMVGVVGKKAVDNKVLAFLGANKIAKGMAIKFRILNLTIDPNTTRLRRMGVSMEVGSYQFPRCVKSDSVNEQMKGEANSAIESQINSLYKQDDMTADLLTNLYK